MKTRIVPTKLLSEIWLAGIENVLFPSALSEKLKPDEILDLWGEDIQIKRESFRAKVDRLIDKLIESDTPQMLWTKISEIDPTLIALYYDRIEAATFALDALKEEKEFVEIPDSWFSFVSLLLKRKIFQ